MEDPSKAQQKAKMDRIAKTSKYNQDELTLKRTMLIIMSVLTLISIILGVVNLALFIIEQRTFPLPSPANVPWLSLTSKDFVFYIWAAAGLYSFLAIVEAGIGLQITDGKQKVATAYVYLGPVVVLMALAQAGSGALLFVAHFQVYTALLSETQFLLSLIDIVVATAGLLIAVWILAVWFVLLRKRKLPSPKKKAERREDNGGYDSEESYEESEYDSESGSESETDEESDEEKEKPSRRKRSPGKKMVNPAQNARKGVFIPMPPRGPNQPRVIVINPKMRRPTQIPTRVPPFRPPYGLRQNFNPYPPMRGPLPIAPPPAPYQTPYRPPQQQYQSPYQPPQAPYQVFPGRNLPLAYQPRY